MPGTRFWNSRFTVLIIKISTDWIKPKHHTVAQFEMKEVGKAI
jgi:hypothetical protein